MNTNVESIIDTAKSNLIYFFIFMILLVFVALVYKVVLDKKSKNR